MGEYTEHIIKEENMMKKVLSLLLSVMMVMTMMAGCGSKEMK